MYKHSKCLFTLSLLCTSLALTPLFAQQASPNKNVRIGLVNFKTCVEQSNIGKSEQANFEQLKKQMESVLAEKEKTINEMSTKFNDADYLDSLSPEAETELKRKFRTMNQEISQQQQQYMQTLQQTNMKVIQNLTEMVSKAATKIAESEKLDLILNEESSFFYSPDIDYTKKVVKILDEEYEKSPKIPTAPQEKG